jgi:microcystin-dependent protein
MSEPFLGQIKMFAGNFAPRGYAFCNGQLLAISSNDALFSLLGTIYGGDGRTTFGLPDLRGRAPIHYGQGAGLSARPIGQKAGSENVALTANQIPAHNHALKGSANPANSFLPADRVPAKANRPGDPDVEAFVPVDPTSLTPMSNASLQEVPGLGQPHDNVQPFQAINFIIALVGYYPSRQ